MKICQNCGMSISDTATFCSNCGATMQQSPSSTATSYQQPPQNTNYYPNQQNQQQENPFYQSQQYQPPAYTPYPSYPNTAPQKRSAPLVLGIIGIIFALLLPIVTYCCSIPGLVMANKDIAMGANNQAARILNIVAIIIAAINSFFGVIMQLSMF